MNINDVAADIAADLSTSVKCADRGGRAMTGMPAALIAAVKESRDRESSAGDRAASSRIQRGDLRFANGLARETIRVPVRIDAECVARTTVRTAFVSQERAVERRSRFTTRTALQAFLSPRPG